ncbi:DUF3987 domain-containing protein [Flavobacterium sp. 14A]|uniref:DUF3987 domain-containing protein n=1 Tax=Flavobacterium sp. 14A TaxID=2735896 RepID=UPI00156FFCF7|nr:DUF3987 domain-containing protein [Flavobacterium sp. 14A]NRT11151.1 hypothetical protein [Flavobacterium sp. 14A]
MDSAIAHNLSTKYKDTFDPKQIILKSLPNVKSNRDKATNISLFDMVNGFKDEAKRKPFDNLRSLTDPVKKANLKTTKFKAYSISIDVNDQLTALLTLDIDHIKETYNKTPQEVIQLICKYYPVLIGSTSIGGDGAFIIMRYNLDNDLKAVFDYIESDLEFTLGIKLDDLKDVARLRIDTFDENTYINWNAGVYNEFVQEVEPEPVVKQIDNFDLAGNTPAQAFNNDPKSIEVINELLEQQGYTITAGKTPALFEYQRPGGKLRSMVCFNNEGIFKFQVFSSNTGLLKDVYNCYELYKELAGLTDYEASKRLSVLNFGKFIESNKNLFPIDVFPPRFRDYANDLKQTVNYPIDYTGTAMLAATATAAGANLKVIVKSGWIEQGSIFCCLLGNAGANKTHPINTIFAPIKAIDKDRHDNYKFEYDIYASYDKLSKKDKEALDNVFAPTLEKSILSNFTTEILFKRLSENPRGCTVVSDELISFLEGMNNYSKSDQIGFYLSVWSNQSTTVDRVGNAIPLFISNPYLSIIGGLQPRALNKAFPPDKLNNGFFQRFLFAYPDDAKKEPLNDNVANAHLAQKYEAFINGLFKIDEPKTLTFSPAAKTYFYEWQSNNCDQVNEHQNSIKGEILSKYDNHFIRLALLVQIMTDSSNDQIEIEAVHAAKALCDYYLNCAFKVLAKIQNKESYLLSLPQDKQQLFNGLDQQFTTAEAIAAGASLEMIERTVKNYLTDSSLFKKVKHGIYLKCQ